VWLAANLLRARNSVQPIPCAADRRPDYKVSGPLSRTGVLLEVKRYTPSGKVSPPDPRHECFGFVPSTFAAAGFFQVAGKRVNRAASQLNALSRSLGESSPPHAVALDVTASHTFQFLLATDSTPDGVLLSEVRREAGTHSDRALLLFVVSYPEPLLYHARWIGPRDA
jgi:hypothetical protein